VSLTDADEFEALRARLRRLAYRMLGSVSDAEDVVQEGWLRWTKGGQHADDPAGWLVRVVSRICLDRLRKAKAERAAYRGPWLPEPLVEPLADDPAMRAEDVSVAFLLALERLSPLQRATFLLHDVFGEDYPMIAQALGRSEPAVRQLAARARADVRTSKPRYVVDRARAEELTNAFFAALGSADPSRLRAMLAEDAIMMSDGGGKVPAALRVLVGREDVARLLEGVSWRWRAASTPGAFTMRLVRINGVPGAVVDFAGQLQTIALEPDDDGRLATIYVMRNPEKLRHVSGRGGSTPC
jgi:RNA polymerase sigma-70 factor (ECF subfamily)